MPSAAGTVAAAGGGSPLQEQVDMTASGRHLAPAVGELSGLRRSSAPPPPAPPEPQPPPRSGTGEGSGHPQQPPPYPAAGEGSARACVCSRERPWCRRRSATSGVRDRGQAGARGRGVDGPRRHSADVGARLVLRQLLHHLPPPLNSRLSPLNPLPQSVTPLRCRTVRPCTACWTRSHGRGSLRRSGRRRTSSSTRRVWRPSVAAPWNHGSCYHCNCGGSLRLGHEEEEDAE